MSGPTPDRPHGGTGMQPDFTPDRALYPFTSRWFQTSAGRMHYIDEGTGPTILFCHGNPTWSFLYRNIITRLSDSYRCVAADLHGFGLSERPADGYTYSAEDQVRTLGELVDRLELDQFVVMGQDWGGPTGLGVAVDRAERIRGVVLGNTWFWPSEAPLFRVFSHLAATQPAQWLILHRNAFVKGMPALSVRTLSPLEREHYLAVQPTPAARVAVAAFPVQISSARALLARLEHAVPAQLGHKPALITWGMKDWGFRAGEMQRTLAAFDNPVLVELPTASHFIQEDAPREIAEAIARIFPASPIRP